MELLTGSLIAAWPTNDSGVLLQDRLGVHMSARWRLAVAVVLPVAGNEDWDKEEVGLAKKNEQDGSGHWKTDRTRSVLGPPVTQ